MLNAFITIEEAYTMYESYKIVERFKKNQGICIVNFYNINRKNIFLMIS